MINKASLIFFASLIFSTAWLRSGYRFMTRIIDNASASDARVLALDPWSERFLTSEKNNVILIRSPRGEPVMRVFFTALGGKPDSNEFVVPANAVSALAFLCGLIQTKKTGRRFST
ncbi:hypothetical protein A1507_11500 [Methylomonas koyamae]|uniref:Uncharacterized protein n=1 Tax=Methylomonas koyamae TaxID=702114 RepID=A0A177NFC8_9GAMM|nr:hypothetical protein [Methylomonas koyamae]OAI16625.1 hypothetical protein A1507_11500 [Methylomonas koyamae]